MIQISNSQARRFSSRLPFGNKMRFTDSRIPKPISTIIQPEEDITVYIEVHQHLVYTITIGNHFTVSDLVARIQQKMKVDHLETQCRYLQFGGVVMCPESQLREYELKNEHILKTLDCLSLIIQVSIKLMGTDYIVTRVSASQSTQIMSIESQIKDEFKLKHINLYFGNNQLSGEFSLADLGIFTDCQIILQCEGSNGVRSSCKINLHQGGEISADEVQEDQKLQCYDTHLSKFNLQTANSMKRYKSSFFTQVTLINDRILLCEEGNYLYNSQKEWKLCDKDSKERLKIDDHILTSWGKYVKVKNIRYIQRKKSQQMVAIKLKKDYPFIVETMLVRPAITLTILYLQEDKYSLYSINVHAQMKVLQLKQKIHHEIEEMNAQSQFLYTKNRLLKNDQLIEAFYFPHIVILLDNREQMTSKIQKKTISFVYDGKTKEIGYNQSCNSTFQEIIERQFEANIREHPYYGIIYNQDIVELHLRLKDVVPLNEQFYYQNYTFIVIKSPEKFILRKLLQTHHNEQPTFIERSKSFFKNLFSPESSLVSTYNEVAKTDGLLDLFNHLHLMRIQDVKAHELYEFVIEFIQFISKLSNYYGSCHRILPDRLLEQDLRIGDLVTTRNFMSCCKQQEAINSILENQERTLLHIQSLTGKNIQGIQVVFVPYTYLLINKIERNGNILEVWASELPTSLYLKQKLIIWVDDTPKNNVKYIESKQIRSDKVEVIQLTSTDMAVRWFKEFGWIVNFLRLPMKVVTDMVREEEGRMNYFAGIDLIEALFNKIGLTTPVLIFCSSAQKGLENVESRQIRKDRIWKITNIIKDLHNYINFKEVQQN